LKKFSTKHYDRMTRRILFVSIAFPPKGDPECIQTARYSYYLSLHQEFVVDVVTSKSPTLFMPLDAALAKYINVSGQVIEIPLYESKYTNFALRKFFPGLLSKPDSKMTFHWQWKKVIKSLKVKPDIIYSRSYPLSSAIMALKLSRFYKIPWVLHLSDPWTENALHVYSDAELVYHTRMEKACFEQASLISFTSEKMASMYQQKYPAWKNKMTVFPNVYDPQLAAGATVKRSSDVVKIVYTGGLANTRTAQSFLAALDLMIKKSPHLVTALHVVFAGDMDRRNNELFKRYKFPFLEHFGLVSTDTAKQLQEEADILVVIDSKIPDANKAVFFPSKLLDYAILQKPIVAITDKGSVTEGFVVGQGGASFSHDAVEDLADWLSMYIEGKIKLSMKEIDTYFSAPKQASRLAQVFKNI